MCGVGVHDIKFTKSQQKVKKKNDFKSQRARRSVVKLSLQGMTVKLTPDLNVTLSIYTETSVP